MNLALPAAPASLLDAQGKPIFGRFAGHLPEMDWQGLQSPWQRSAIWRRFHHKRWRYIALATEEIFCGIALVDLGWASTAFAYVFERTSRQQLAAFSQDGLPGLAARISPHPFDGADCRFVAGGKQIRFWHLAGSSQYHLELRAGTFSIEAELNAQQAAPALLAVGEIAGGSVHATQKSAGLQIQGQVKTGAQRFDLAGGVGSFDYSSGMLQRDTAWRWASAHSHSMGFNLQQGYFAAQENALWLDGQVYPLGPAEFVFDPHDPAANWQIHTTDGLLEMQFTPEGARQQNKNLGVAISRYLQPIGCFSGSVKTHANGPAHKFSNLLGVTEDHFSRW